MPAYRPLVERFWEKVEKTDSCWLWTAHRAKTGYGQITCRGVVLTSHRISFEWAYGPIPKGMFVCHHCDTPACVRPDHLFLGDAGANARDMVRKGRHFSPCRDIPHCLRGHPFSAENTYCYKNHRGCRTCLRERSRAYYRSH